MRRFSWMVGPTCDAALSLAFVVLFVLYLISKT
jgi:hypothetical protein